MDDITRHGLGGNSPPPDLKVGEALREELHDQHRGLLERRDALLAGADAFEADHAVVETDEVSGVLAGIIAQLMSAAKSADKVREGVKSPYLDGGRIVDGFFGGPLVAKLTARAALLNQKQTAYQRAKADRVRREAEERAQAARAEEDRRRREAEKAERERLAAARAARKTLDDAKANALAQTREAEALARAQAAREAEERARIERQKQTQIATSTAADRSRVRGDYAMASLRTTWRFRITDITKVPAEFLAVNETLVNSVIRGETGRRDIPGLEIFPDTQAVNR